MKIACWENGRNFNGQMDFMAAISVMLSINYYKKVILLDNGQANNSLERAFRGTRRFYFVKEDSNYFIHRNGMDQLIKDIHTVNCMEHLLYDSAVEVIQNYLYYVPPSKVINHLAYDYVLYQELGNIIHSYESIADFIMIRVRNGDHLSTKQVLDEAELVMVEMSQDLNVLDEFFENHSSIRHKAVFVFNQYNSKSLSIYNIMKKYHLRKEQVVVLTEHMPLCAAYLAGNLVSYIKGNCNCDKGSEHYRCIQEMKRSVKLILKCERGELLATMV